MELKLIIYHLISCDSWTECSTDMGAGGAILNLLVVGFEIDYRQPLGTLRLSVPMCKEHSRTIKKIL